MSRSCFNHYGNQQANREVDRAVGKAMAGFVPVGRTMRYAVSGRDSSGMMISEGFKEANSALLKLDEFLERKLTDIRILDESGHFVSEAELRACDGLEKHRPERRSA
jgi:hypothetical protein